MLIFITFLGITLTIPVISNAECEKDSFSACAPPDTFPLRFPGNDNEFDASCSIVTQYMECVRNHEISCKGSFKYEEHFTKVYGTLRKICSEESSFHKPLRDNIMCIKLVLNVHNVTCFSDKQQVSGVFRHYILRNEEKDDAVMNDKELDMMYCLQHSLDISCFLKDVEDCGRAVKNICLEIIKHSGFITDGCPTETIWNISHILPDLELEEYEERQIRHIFLLAEESS